MLTGIAQRAFSGENSALIYFISIYCTARALRCILWGKRDGW